MPSLPASNNTVSSPDTTATKIAPGTTSSSVAHLPINTINRSDLLEPEAVASDDSSSFPTEVDCEQAEELADWGEYEAADIADYCDIGPEPYELPDEFDWDK